MSTLTNTNNEAIIETLNMADSMPISIPSQMEVSSTSIATFPDNSEEKTQFVKNNMKGSASAMATTGNDSWSTPKSQYEGFKPLIDALSGGNRLKIWDPFYFNGIAAEYMAQVFKNSDIIHEDRKVDLVPFQLPNFAAGTQLIFTNPPFSIAKQVLEWMLSLKIPFIACLPVAVATNKRTNPLIRQHKIQIIKSNGRIAFEQSGSPKDSPTGKRDTQWYCYGLSLPAEVQWWYVGSLEGEMGQVQCLGNSNKKRKRHCQTDQNANATKRGNYKKSAKFLAKAAAKRARKESAAKSLQEDFEEWFEKYCKFIVQEPQLRVICTHLRKIKPNSYQQYCERNNKPFLNKKGFDAAILKKTGGMPVQGTGNNWRFNHIKFVSGE